MCMSSSFTPSPMMPVGSVLRVSKLIPPLIIVLLAPHDFSHVYTLLNTLKSQPFKHFYEMFNCLAAVQWFSFQKTAIRVLTFLHRILYYV